MSASEIVNKLLEADDSDDLDPKSMATRATVGLPPDTLVKFQCPFTTTGENETHPYYFSDTLGDWDHDWVRADAFRLGDYIHDGVIDQNDFPFGTESVVVVNPDGSPGADYTLDDLGVSTAEMIDTYVSPDAENEAHREANPDQYYPRAPRGQR